MQDKNDAAEVNDVERHVDELLDIHAPDPKPSPRGVTLETSKGAPTLPVTPNDYQTAIDNSVKQEQVPDVAVSVPDSPPVPIADPKLTKSSPVDGEDDPLVDQIIIKESDESLAAQDAMLAKAFDTHQPSFKERVRDVLKAWWGNKKARYGTFAGLALLLVMIMIVPTSRYFILNSAGVRAATSLKVLDQSTQLPLKNVGITIDDQTVKTDQAGVAKLKDLKLGNQKVVVSQLGFAKVERMVTLGLGSNPLGEISLKAIGLQFQFKLVDFLSGKPVQKAQATSGDANALSDSKGTAVLTVAQTDEAKLTVSITASGYRTERVTLDAASTQVTSLNLVPKRKEQFVSKQSGKYDVYKMDLDGKNKELLLAGTGLETDQITLVAHPSEEEAALVSTRDNKRNQDGYLLQSLTLIDIEKGTTISLDSSERIQIVDWIKDKLVYVKVKAGTSAGNSERYQLMSYDYTASARLQLATANYFSDIVSAKGSIYYAAANNYKDGQDQFVTVKPDNTGKQVLLNTGIWNILRSGYDDLYLSSQEGWYSYHLGDSGTKKLATPPGNINDTRFYLDSPDGKNALWTEARDGKGVLLSYDSATQKDKVLVTQGGLYYPLRWLNSRTVVYRVSTPQETADYALSLDGGAARKLTDVTNVMGFGRWYYY